MENHRPLFCALGVRLAEPPKLLGESGKHISMQLVQHGRRMRAVGFGHAEDWFQPLSDLAPGEPIDLAFRPVINQHGGYKSVEVHLVDWRLHQQHEMYNSRALASG
jgi:single-stranded-DNA-specific exonuclease